MLRAVVRTFFLNSNIPGFGQQRQLRPAVEINSDHRPVQSPVPQSPQEHHRSPPLDAGGRMPDAGCRMTDDKALRHEESMADSWGLSQSTNEPSSAPG